MSSPDGIRPARHEDVAPDQEGADSAAGFTDGCLGPFEVAVIAVSIALAPSPRIQPGFVWGGVYDPVVEVGDPADLTWATAEDHDFDLIVTGAGDRGQAPVAPAVTRRSSVLVLLVP